MEGRREAADSDQESTISSLLPLPELTPEEKEFTEKIKSGDLKTAQSFYEDHPELNINAVDMCGLTALHFAVEGRNKEMVSWLLSIDGIMVRDVVLHAVNTGDLELAEILLDAIK
ncbi:hypothetical protein LAZ67_3001827 [Cordylochernes scorpioides]|uniref:Uncharacterized protein n=1 Tax=Cordylochernes scorpioides TaxID=51811 RepID=A0ABY6KA66_9ARAC|nr:hypothetical protein LAZ67_3001827 [Cordylochernes scorpioides]